MENIDPDDPNLDGDFKALLKRHKELEKENNDTNTTDHDATENEIYAQRAAARSQHMGIKKKQKTSTEEPFWKTELLQFRLRLFDAAENRGQEECHKIYTSLINNRNYGRKTLSDPDLRDPEDSHTVLHHALMHKNLDVAQFFINIKDMELLMQEYNVFTGTLHSNKNALHLLVEFGDVELTRLFLKMIEGYSKKAKFLEKTTLLEMVGQRPRKLTPLHMATLNGNTKIMNLLIEAGMNVNIQNSKGDTPIIWASRWNHIETANRLLELGADANLENDKHSTPLYWAVRYGYPEMTRLLLSKGKADVNYRRKLGFEVSIVLAAALGYPEILKILLDNGAIMSDKTSAGMTALHIAAIYGNNKVIDTLLDYDPPAQIENQDNIGNTALMYSVMYGHTLCAKNLLSSGAYIHSSNLYGDTVWGAAVNSKNETMLDTLVEFYKSSRRMDHKLIFPVGKTPLHFAALQGNVDHIAMLLDKGADPHARDFGGNTFYHIAAGENKITILEKFFDTVDINEINNNGNTPIHLASQAGHLEAVEILMKKAQLGIKNKLQESVLHTCAKCTADSAPRVAALLVTTIVNTQSWGLMDSQNANGDTALHIVARTGNPVIVTEFNKLNPKIKNKDGCNPLHVAAVSDNREVLKAMLLHFHIPSTGLKINEPKEDGETLLHISANKGDAEMVQLLIERGADLKSADFSGNTMLHDLAYHSTIDPTNNEQHLQVFQTVVENCTQWWCTKHDLYFPERGSPPYKEIQRQALIYLLEDVYNNLNFSVKNYASDLAATSILQAIFNLPDIFLFREKHFYIYDITNISPETMAIKPVEKKRSKHSLPSASVGILEDDDLQPLKERKSNVVVKDTESCLDIIVRMENSVLATKVLDVTPIKFVVEDYWNVYRFIYGILMLFHITYMSLYSVYAIPLANEIWLLNETALSTPYTVNSVYGLFLVPPIVIIVFAIYYLSVASWAVLGRTKSNVKDDKLKYDSWCSYGIAGFVSKLFNKIIDSLFLIGGVTFSCLVIGWFIAYMVASKNQVYFLSIALLVGWIYTIAYSKGFRTVHAFTIMLQEIILRDITRFAFIYIFILFGFSYSMHALFQMSSAETANFPTIWYTLFEAFNIMLGAGEVVRDETDGNYSAVGSSGIYIRIIYIMYAVTAAIILLNLIVAMMSDSYNAIKSKEGTTWRVGSVRMAINIEHSMKIIARVFHALRKMQSRLPVTFDDDKYRYMLSIPVSEVEKSNLGEINENVRAMKLLESKLNFLNNQFSEMNHRFGEVADRYDQLEDNVCKIQESMGISTTRSNRPKTAGLRKRISKI